MDPKFHGLAWTGSRLLDVRNPTSEMLDLRDIARGLARKYRFGGHTKDNLAPYSVAWHSLFCETVADQMGLPIWVRLQALFHDAPEFILGDFQTPIKVLFPSVSALEDGLWRAIARRFGIPETWDPAIKEIDHLALEVERTHLIPADAWDPAPQVPEKWAEVGRAWIAFAQSKQGGGRFAAALFHSRAEALLIALNQEESA